MGKKHKKKREKSNGNYESQLNSIFAGEDFEFDSEEENGLDAVEDLPTMSSSKDTIKYISRSNTNEVNIVDKPISYGAVFEDGFENTKDIQEHEHKTSITITEDQVVDLNKKKKSKAIEISSLITLSVNPIPSQEADELQILHVSKKTPKKKKKSKIKSTVTENSSMAKLEQYVESLRKNGDKILFAFIDGLKSRIIQMRQQVKESAQENKEKFKQVVRDEHKLLSCEICMEVYASPQIIECGHSFCYNCIKCWAESQNMNGSCPLCRKELYIRPFPNLLLAKLVDSHVAHLAKETQIKIKKRLEKEKELFKVDNPWPNWNDVDANVIEDIADNVYRCVHCGWEIEDQQCVNCGHRYSTMELANMYLSDETESDSRSSGDEYQEDGFVVANTEVTHLEGHERQDFLSDHSEEIPVRSRRNRRSRQNNTSSSRSQRQISETTNSASLSSASTQIQNSTSSDAHNLPRGSRRRISSEESNNPDIAITSNEETGNESENQVVTRQRKRTRTVMSDESE